jgi:hypothetical protein
VLALPYSFSLIIHVYILLLFTYHLRPERDYHINPLLNVKFLLVCLRWQLKAKHRSMMTRVYNMDLYDPLPLPYQWLHCWTSPTGLSLGRREWNIKYFSAEAPFIQLKTRGRMSSFRSTPTSGVTFWSWLMSLTILRRDLPVNSVLNL